jgi:hypothetical protein
VADTVPKFAQDVGVSVKTVLNCRTVAQRFPAGVRRDDLSFTAHEEFAAIKDAEERAELLAEASTAGWPASRCREVARERRALPAGKPQQPSSKLTIPVNGNASTSKGPAALPVIIPAQPQPAEPAPAPAPPTSPSSWQNLNHDLATITGERDDLAEKLAALNNVRDDLAEAQQEIKTLNASLAKAQQHAHSLSEQLAAQGAELAEAKAGEAESDALLSAVIDALTCDECRQSVQAACKALDEMNAQQDQTGDAKQ